jgi:hypothetical protein
MTSTQVEETPQDPAANIIRWARVGIMLALIPLATSAFRGDGRVPLLGDIDLAIHEFGHILWSPFGETLTIIGGSLTQILLPCLFAAYFLYGKRDHRDPHAAMLCVWWTAMNILDVSVYAADARAGQLMLLSGLTGEDDPEGHDFHNLFARWGVLDRDTIYAGRMRGIAAFMAFLSILFGLYAAWNSGRKELSREPSV